MPMKRTYQIRPYQRGFAIYLTWMGLPVATLARDHEFYFDNDRLFCFGVAGFGSHEQAIEHLQTLIRRAGLARYRKMSYARAVKRHAAAHPPRCIPPWKV